MGSFGLDILGAGAALGGSAMESNAQKDINAANQEWATNMSNTAYQRAVADMQAAGLNPMAMYGGGGAGGAASAPVVQGQAASMGKGLAQAGSIMLNAAQRQADVEKTEQTVKVEKQEEQNRKEQQHVIKAQADLTRHAAREKKGDASVAELRGIAADAAIPSARKAERALNAPGGTKGHRDTYGGEHSAKSADSSRKGGGYYTKEGARAGAGAGGD